jgi:hypothetical protein
VIRTRLGQSDPIKRHILYITATSEQQPLVNSERPKPKFLQKPKFRQFRFRPKGYRYQYQKTQLTEIDTDTKTDTERWKMFLENDTSISFFFDIALLIGRVSNKTKDTKFPFFYKKKKSQNFLKLAKNVWILEGYGVEISAGVGTEMLADTKRFHNCQNRYRNRHFGKKLIISFHYLSTMVSLNPGTPNLRAMLIEKPLKKQPPMYKGHYFGVPRVVVVDRFGCIW